jgi:hypothetical protein
MNEPCKNDEHAWQLIKDIDGSGRDCSFYQCQICGEERDPHEMNDIPIENRPDWVLSALARLGYFRDNMPPEDVKAVQRFLDSFTINPPTMKESSDE